MGKRRRLTADHAEGEHGLQTRWRIMAQLRASPPESAAARRLERQRQQAAELGKRRLVEDRQQHDEAEKNSERPAGLRGWWRGKRG
ncbi:MAG TPA: hypothetical protein VJN70_19320 [Gemmatimonadaceae bacterium]|nr:hypothetical protein [Gemmatimonadaceae bacterium]